MGELIPLIGDKELEHIRQIVEYEKKHKPKDRNISDEDFKILSEIEQVIEIPILPANLDEITDIFASDKNALYYINAQNKLSGLRLTQISISEIPPAVAKLKDLEYLQISDNFIKDIEILSSLKKLRFLDISFNWIQNICPLKELKNLKYLECQGQGDDEDEDDYNEYEDEVYDDDKHGCFNYFIHLQDSRGFNNLED